MCTWPGVKVNGWYKYVPVPLDMMDSRTDLSPGDVVQVKNMPGCPPANTMDHAHVCFNGKFAGMVHVNSLVKTKKPKESK